MFSWSTSTGKYPGARNRVSSANNNVPSSQFSSSMTSGGIPRSEHLKSLLEDPMLKPSTRRVSQDDSTYDVVFQTKSNITLILRVHIPNSPTGHPCHAPAMTLIGILASHPWIDKKMRVIGFNAISSDTAWNSSGITLGSAVNAVVHQFQLNPPSDVEVTDPGLKKIQQRPTQTQRPSVSTINSPPILNSIENEDMTKAKAKMKELNFPSIPNSFPDVDQMNRDEMESLLNDESKFDDFINKLPITIELNNLRNSVIDETVRYSNENISKQEDLTTLKSEVESLRENISVQISTFEKLDGERKKLCMPPNQKDVIKLLQQSKKNAFNESEELASIWVDEGDLKIEEFVKQFLVTRKVYHERAAKIERLNYVS